MLPQFQLIILSSSSSNDKIIKQGAQRTEATAKETQEKSFCHQQTLPVIGSIVAIINLLLLLSHRRKEKIRSKIRSQKFSRNLHLRILTRVSAAWACGYH